MRRAAVLGSPVAHSLSPVLHRAAYAALDLPHWRYDAIECDDVALAAFVGGLGPEWAGLSVTMPGKRAALDVADSVTPTAAAVGAANTLVQGPDGHWLADCTDVDGILGALAARGVPATPSERASPPRESGTPKSQGIADLSRGVLAAPSERASPPLRSGIPGSQGTADRSVGSVGSVGLEGSAGSAPQSTVVLGAGGTAQAAIVALATMGVTSLTVIARSALRATDAVACAARVGLPARVGPWPSPAGLPLLRGDVLISTVPAGVIDAAAAGVLAARFPIVLDVVYHPWPTPLAEAVSAAGGRLATGLDMLLHQAFGQVELFTRQPAPREAMRSALRSAVGPGCPPLPL